jgi:plasmid stabilization system protein ParE
MKIIWSPLAIDRASEIAEYIAQDKPAAAEKWINTVFSKVEQLKSSPEIGRIVPEIRNDQFRDLKIFKQSSAYPSISMLFLFVHLRTKWTSPVLHCGEAFSIHDWLIS